jgi:hypothetical protein
MFKNCRIVGNNIDPEAYHRLEEKRGDAGYPMSPSALKEFAQCPSRWIAGYRSPDSESKYFGSLLDVLLLTPEMFPKKYAVTPEKYEATAMECPVCKSQTDSKSCKGCKTDRVPVKLQKDWNNNATACAEWIAQQGSKEIVSQKSLAQAEQAVKRILEFEPHYDFPIKRFIEASDKQVLVVGEWHDEATGMVVPVRCLLDLVPRNDTEFAKCLGDLKSTRCAAIIPFQRDVFKMRYHVQAAFDTDLYIEATNHQEDRNTWCLIVQENFEPFQPGKRIMSDMPETPGNYIALGRATYRKQLKLYCACLKSGKWPSYDDNEEAVTQGWTPVSAEPWMESEAMFSPQIEADEPDEPKEELELTMLN